MMNKLFADLLDVAIEDLTKMRNEIRANMNYHVDDEMQKRNANELRDIADILCPVEDEK